MPEFTESHDPSEASERDTSIDYSSLIPAGESAEAADAEPPDHAVVKLPDEAHNSFFGGKVIISEVIPAGNAAPDGCAVYFANGFGFGTEESYLTEIARHGRRAFTLRFGGQRKSDKEFEAIPAEPEPGGPALRLSRKQVADQLRRGNIGAVLPRQTMNQAATFLAVVAERGQGPVDAIGQSEDGPHVLAAAFADAAQFEKDSDSNKPYQHKIQNIVLAYTSFSDEAHSASEAARRVRLDVQVKRESPVDSDDSFQLIKNKGPFSKGGLPTRTDTRLMMADAAAFRFVTQAPFLDAVMQRPDRPGVALVFGANDNIFPPGEGMDALTEPPDFILIAPAGHGVLFRKNVLDETTKLFARMNILKDERKAAEREGRPLSFEPLRNRLIFMDGVPEEQQKELRVRADQLDSRRA